MNTSIVLFVLTCFLQQCIVLVQCTVDNQFNKNILKLHNKVRQQHNSPQLVTDKTVAQAAQKWAEHMAQLGHMAMSPNKKYGQNLYGTSDPEFTARDVTDLWFGSSEGYDYTREPTKNEFQRVGTFTQMVWKSTKQLGCGKAFGSDEQIYVCCFYSPPGNVNGRFVKNV